MTRVGPNTFYCLTCVHLVDSLPSYSDFTLPREFYPSKVLTFDERRAKIYADISAHFLRVKYNTALGILIHIN